MWQLGTPAMAIRPIRLQRYRIDFRVLLLEIDIARGQLAFLHARMHLHVNQMSTTDILIESRSKETIRAP
jgi:hypothetical protein